MLDSHSCLAEHSVPEVRKAKDRVEKLRIRVISLLASATVVGALAALAHGQGARPVVYLVPIEGVIDLGLAPLASAASSRTR